MLTCTPDTRRQDCLLIMPNLIDGRAIAEKVYVDLRREIAELKTKGLTPGLASSCGRRPSLPRVRAGEGQNVSRACGCTP